MKQQKVHVKISHKNLTRIECLGSNPFQQLKNRLYKHFQLLAKTYYQLCYRPQKQAQISITNEVEFKQFLSTRPKLPKLFLKITEDPKLHFTGRPFEVKAYEEQNEELEFQASKLRQQMNTKLSEMKANLIQNVKQQLKQKQKQQAVKPKENNQIHYGFNCESCQMKNIQGIRYQCAICNYHLCQSCENKPKKHNQTHPFIKIKDPRLQIALKNNLLLSESLKDQLKKQPKVSKQTLQLAAGLMQIFPLSEKQACEFINSYPKKDLSQLVEIYLSKS